MHKASTTPSDPVAGVLDVMRIAADAAGLSLADYLGRGEILVHGTTHAINAIVTGRTARTAFLTTAGHPDMLVFREGGRQDAFNFTVPYPEPFVPRALTFEVAGAHHRQRRGPARRSTRRGSVAVLDRLKAAEGRGGRRLLPVVDRQSRARARRRPR